MAKLRREAVEDLRIDFEDGYGLRPDAEEDRDAIAVADEMALGMARSTLPARVGIRVKAFGGPLSRRSARTLDLFVTRLLERAGALPPRFVITLPKAQSPEQVAAFVELLSALERATRLPEKSLQIELMIETLRAVVDDRGAFALPSLLAASDQRCVAAHLGAYDLLADAGVTAQHQSLDHPMCDLVRQVLITCGTRSGIALSDGATTAMPIGPHRGDPSALTRAQEDENRSVVHAAWRAHHRNVQHALRTGIYQGWDLHPAQLPARYGAIYAFFLDSLDVMSARLSHFVAQATRATLSGAVFDDAATGQGLLNFFVRALSCGAIDPAEVSATGLTTAEIEGRSFLAILAGREERGR